MRFADKAPHAFDGFAGQLSASAALWSRFRRRRPADSSFERAGARARGEGVETPADGALQALAPAWRGFELDEGRRGRVMESWAATSPARLRPSMATGSTARSPERRQRESFRKRSVSRQT